MWVPGFYIHKVERVGMGIKRMRRVLSEAGLKEPLFETDGFFRVVLYRSPEFSLLYPKAPPSVTAEVAAQVTAEVAAQVATFCREPKPAKAIMKELGLKHWKTFQSNYLAPLMNMGIIERTVPGKPRSRLQKYRLTKKGKKYVGDKK